MDSVSQLNIDLWYAAAKGDLEAVKTALAKGADINFRINSTSVEIAEHRGHFEIVKYLLSKNAISSGLKNKYEVNENQNIRTKEENKIVKEDAIL